MADDTPIPAATLVLFREGADAPELLMVERSRAMVFAAGAVVFPGGRIDPGDWELAGGDADKAARIAAIRETIEETGVPVGLSAAPDAETLAALRGGQPFGAALAGARLRLDLDALTPFARWLPRHAHMRIFDTRFYLAKLPAGAPEARVDQTENVRVFWRSAQAMLDEVRSGSAHAIFPTRRNLERLAAYPSFEAARADALARPGRTITPFTELRGDTEHLCIPDDLGYPVTSEPLASAFRS